MFSAIANTALTVLLLQALVAGVQGWTASRTGYAAALRDTKNPKRMREFRAHSKVEREHTMHVMFLRGAFARMWCMADLYFTVAGKSQHRSRIRTNAYAVWSLVALSANASGADVMDGVGLGAVVGGVVFAIGALGVLSGRLAATAGDKRILGL